ncbi:MAG: cysteine--tRNA ligase [Puniceicoccales bacterium]|jgi:cysteinyl-tRNA synthetase|nr:cysteine--tRNA ligase [Puniceicoccales bacterium]
MIAVSLHNTLSGQKERLQPSADGLLRVYCCGPTVYAAAHIGNFRSFLLQDVLRRVLERSGYRVRWVRNLTDVDDKTIRGSRQQGIPLREFTDPWIQVFREDCQKLQILPPDVEPRATEHIDEQIHWIQRLIGAGFAYPDTDGSIYYRLSSFPSYGRLSRLPAENLRPKTKPPVDADEYDGDSVHDFVLWKARKEEDGDCHWESPWGLGRPGWHIECSVMALHYLGETLDLHGGGIDLCFPHHENEIAQAEALTKKCFAWHWFHCAHLLVDGKKMSKSLGNCHTLQELLDKGHDPMAVRYALIAGHYRQPLNFSFQSLSMAERALQKLARAREQLQNLAGENVPQKSESLDPREPESPAFQKSESPEEGGSLFSEAWRALRDDLNIPRCLGSIFSTIASPDLGRLSPAEARAGLRGLEDIVLGALGLTLPATRADGPVEIAVPEEVRELAERRQKAREEGNFAEADRLRERIQALGWRPVDRAGHFELKKTEPSG